jgi:hypothetical protein
MDDEAFRLRRRAHLLSKYRLVLEFIKIRQRLRAIQQEEEEEAVDSDTDTVIYEGFDLIETLPSLVPPQRQDAAPIDTFEQLRANQFAHARRN